MARSNISQLATYCYKKPVVEVTLCLGDSLTRYFDFLVTDSEVAGLRYALEVAKYGSVAVITKAEPHEHNTKYDQGGVGAVLWPLDSVESHVQDITVAGAHLGDEKTVGMVCIESPERIRELIAMGAPFDHGEDGACKFDIYELFNKYYFNIVGLAYDVKYNTLT